MSLVLRKPESSARNRVQTSGQKPFRRLNPLALHGAFWLGSVPRLLTVFSPLGIRQGLMFDVNEGMCMLSCFSRVQLNESGAI